MHPLSLSFNNPSPTRPSQVSLEGPPLDQLSAQAGCPSSCLKSAFSLPVSVLIAGVNVVWKLGAGGWEHSEKHHGPWFIQTSFLPTGDASTRECLSPYLSHLLVPVPLSFTDFPRVMLAAQPMHAHSCLLCPWSLIIYRGALRGQRKCS